MFSKDGPDVIVQYRPNCQRYAVVGRVLLSRNLKNIELNLLNTTTYPHRYDAKTMVFVRICNKQLSSTCGNYIPYKATTSITKFASVLAHFCVRIDSEH